MQSYFALLRNISRFRLLSEAVVDVTLCRKGRFFANDDSSPDRWVQDCVWPEKGNWLSISCERDRMGDFQGVVFPCGFTIAAHGGTIQSLLLAPLSRFAARQHSRLFEWLDPDAARNTAATGITR